MPTYLALQSEPPPAAGMWNAETMSPTMQTLALRLIAFYNLSSDAVGSKGDNSPGHMRGAHRSRNWILHSRYCTNRTYTVTETPGNRSGGDGDWLAGMDITLPRDQLLAACQRLDIAVRAGMLEKITEWYGNKDGDLRVDGYDNIRNQVASSDASHLWHLHLTFDRGRAGEDHSDVYAILTGQASATEDDMPVILLTDRQRSYLSNGFDLKSIQTLADLNALRAVFPGPDHIVSQADVDRGLYGEVDSDAPVLELTPEQLAAIAAAAKAGAEAGAPTHDELVDAAEEGANKAEDS